MSIFPEPSKQIADVIEQLTSPDLIDPNPIAMFEKYAKRIPGRIQDDMSLCSPLYPDFDDYDYLHDTSEVPPIYLNDFDINIEEDRERLTKLTRLEFVGNTFKPVAQCSASCGKLRGNHLINSGTVCRSCGNTVEVHYDKQHEVGLWIKCPEGVDAFLSHSFYNTFFTSISVNKQGSPKVIVARYFIDPSYRREFKKKGSMTEVILLDMLKDLDITDISINGFYHNCDRLMQYLIMGPGSKYTGLREQSADAWEFWNKFKSKAFCKYLKVPSRYTTILETNDRGTWGVDGQLETKQIYYTIAGCKKSTEFTQLTQRELQANQGLVGRKLVELTDMYVKKLNKRSLFHKKAISRKHVCAGNLPVTGRRVITSITGLINPNEIVIPWTLAVSMLSVHLTSMLYRNGFTPLKAMRHLNLAMYKIDPLIDNFLARMEKEKKILGESHRNPSNEYLSIKTFLVSVNRCLDDESLKISILSCASYNAKYL